MYGRLSDKTFATMSVDMGADWGWLVMVARGSRECVVRKVVVGIAVVPFSWLTLFQRMPETLLCHSHLGNA